MSFLVRRLILIGIITSLAACANINTNTSTEKTETQFPYQHSLLNLKVAWKTLQTGNDAVIDGLIKIVQNRIVRNIEMNVYVLDTKGVEVSEGAVLPTSINLKMNDYFPFSIKLRNAIIAKGDVLEFIIRYRTNDGSWNGHGWQNSFKVDAVTGAVIEEER
jgi:hypothetical protein